MIDMPALSATLLREPAVRVRAYVESLFMVAVATGFGLLIAPRWGSSAVDLLYLLPVMAAASLFGFGPGMVSALASALAYNFFFTMPVHTFRIHSPADVVTVVMLLAVALVVSRLAAAMRAQARKALANAARNATIAGFAGDLLPCVDAERIGTASCTNLARLFECNAALLVERDGQPATIASEPRHAVLTPADYGAAALVFRGGEVIGRGSPRLSPADWLFFPVKSDGIVLATLGLARDDGRAPVADEQLPLLTNLIDQIALALERSNLERQMQDVASLRERDHLRGALLSSVGHDLRTPLTAILAAAAELRQHNAPALLVDTIDEEGAKLGRYIANLLDMARIEAGSIRLHEEAVDLVDAVGAALRDLKQRAAAFVIDIDLAADLPLVRADPHLLHHVLLNLLDNAMRYSAIGTGIRIAGTSEDNGVTLSIVDQGPGLPDPPRVMFDRFTQIAGSDRKGGAGLGLGIVKGFADAMGVTVVARNNDKGGATFALSFPPTSIVSEARLGQGA
jgi:two-component system sensor histidine kinase KdpD